MATWDELPADVASRILARLPPSSIQQCRRVCRAWRILIDDPYFITLFKEHHRCRARMPLFLYRRNFGLDDPVPEEHYQGVVRMDLQAVDMAATEPHPMLRFHDVVPLDEDEGIFAMDLGDLADPDSGVFRIHGSCDGLLLISHNDNLYLCNPTTGHWTCLPSVNPEQVIVAFYLRDPPDVPKVYRILYADSVAEGQTSYWIRVVGIPVEDEGLHEIGRPLSPGIPVALDRILRRGLRPAYHAPPIALQQTLHWLPPYPGLSNRIVTFDTLQERFAWIRSPGQGPPVVGFQLLELGGLLAMACRNTARTVLEVWVHHNQEKENWVLRHRIQVPETDILQNLRYDQLRSPPAYVVSEELDVFYPCPYSLLHCSSDGEVRRSYHCLGHWVLAVQRKNFNAVLEGHCSI